MPRALLRPWSASFLEPRRLARAPRAWLLAVLPALWLPASLHPQLLVEGGQATSGEHAGPDAPDDRGLAEEGGLDADLSSAAADDPLGEQVYLSFCSGCHGFGGFAFYPPAPSFALGDRMSKSDDALLESVLKGKGEMPSWEDKLPVDLLLRDIRHMRKLSLEPSVPRRRPEWFYRFRPAEQLHVEP